MMFFYKILQKISYILILFTCSICQYSRINTRKILIFNKYNIQNIKNIVFFITFCQIMLNLRQNNV